MKKECRCLHDYVYTTDEERKRFENFTAEMLK